MFSRAASHALKNVYVNLLKRWPALFALTVVWIMIFCSANPRRYARCLLVICFFLSYSTKSNSIS